MKSCIIARLSRIVTEYPSDKSTAPRAFGRLGVAFHPTRSSLRFQFECSIASCIRFASQKEKYTQEEEAKNSEGPPGKTQSKVRLGFISSPGTPISCRSARFENT